MSWDRLEGWREYRGCFSPYIVLFELPRNFVCWLLFHHFLILCGGFFFLGEGGCLSETNTFDLHVMFPGFLSRDAVT